MATRRRRPEPVHDWERLNRARHDWEPLRLRPDAEIANSEDEEDDEPFNPDECGPEEAAEFFLEQMVSMMMSGEKTSAKSVCIACFWAAKAGAVHLKPWGLKPGSSSGNFQKHLDRRMGVSTRAVAREKYKLVVPQYHKHDLSRTPHPLLVTPPAEALEKEYVDKQLASELRGSLATRSWPPNYYEHPVVRSTPEIVLPCSLYIDGLPFLKRDGMTQITMYNLLTLHRHLICVIRNSHMCKCGCRGWCTIYPVLLMIRWSMEAAGRGVNPERKHDGEPWGEGDGPRAEKAGQPLAVRCCILQIRGDWLEYAKSMGLPTWSSVFFPCMFCKVVRENLYAFKGKPFDPMHFPFELTNQNDYERAAQACEIHVQLTEDLHAQLKRALRFDKAKQGARGRRLTRAFPDVGLLINDRLEPSTVVRDVGAGFDLLTDPWPIVTFWRPGNESRAKHRNPLFCEELGVGIDSLEIDKLHNCYLGIFQDFMGGSLWRCISANVWGLPADLNKDARVHTSVSIIRSELLDYYKELKLDNPDLNLTEIQDLVPTMLGKEDAPALNLKGLETRHALPYVVSLVGRHQGLLGAIGGPLLAAGSALVEFLEVLSASGRVVAARDIQRLHELARSYMTCSIDAGIATKPKLHMFMHLVSRIERHGNPDFYATMGDEEINRALGDIGRIAHRRVWEARMFAYFEETETKKRNPKQARRWLSKRD